MSQHSHESTPFSQRTFPIILICDGVKGPANIGGIFRLAEAFGVQEIIFGNSRPDLNSARMKRTAREGHKRVAYTISEDLLQSCESLKENGYSLLALEISKTSKPLQHFSAKGPKLALIIGNEQHGISEEILKTAETCLHIELFGENSSINVVNALAIALFSLTKN